MANMHARTFALALVAALLLPFPHARAQLFSAPTPYTTHAARAPLFAPTSTSVPAPASASVPAPSDVLGFTPGDDRRLASWAQTVEYFRRLAATSDRVRFEEIGKTTLGAPFVYATISAPENLARLDEFKDIQRRLADPRLLGPNADRKAEALIRRGKTIVLITCGIHSSEVGSALSSILIAYRLASSDEPEIQEILRNTIILLVPSLNPDGVDIVKNWYDKTLGTPYEGTSPPELYHHYTGHDNNRDWYAFTQVETQLTVDKIHNVWHPQIVHDIHQQGAYGSRLFLPPYMQPVEPNVPRQLVEAYTELGHFMADNMLKAGFKGITWDSTYDAWTPARAYSHYHGGVRILSETASANIATPITVKPEQLRAGEGYDARKATPNFPVPWPGGEWHMRDITNNMTTAAFELLKHASANRERWLRRFYSIGRDAVRPRTPGELQGFKLLPSERTYELKAILDRGGVDVFWLKERGKRRRAAPELSGLEDTFFVPMAQPYGGFAKALLETQHYPDLRDKEGHPIPPYDVTAHTLPLLMGVPVEPVYRPLSRGSLWMYEISVIAPVVTSSPDSSITHTPEPEPRFGLYKSHVPSMDEGWTRWVFEENDKKYNSLQDAEVRAGNLHAKFDTIIIPDQSPRAILEGYRKGTMPEELTGGLGKDGVKSLREFVEAGGTLVALNDASDFAIEQFGLPLRDVTEGLKRTEFYCPGSILRTILDTTHPVAKGMPRESIAWVEDSPVFEIKDEKDYAGGRVRVIARYPESGTPLLSGWLLGAERIRGKAALVEVTLGKGRIYLFGFRPQYRGQSLATYPLLFNAIAGAGS
jgi:hypothetical protein